MTLVVAPSGAERSKLPSGRVVELPGKLPYGQLLELERLLDEIPPCEHESVHVAVLVPQLLLPGRQEGKVEVMAEVADLVRASILSRAITPYAPVVNVTPGYYSRPEPPVGSSFKHTLCLQADMDGDAIRPPAALATYPTYHEAASAAWTLRKLGIGLAGPGLSSVTIHLEMK